MLSAILGSPSTAQPDDVQKPHKGKKIRVFLCAGQANMEGRADGNKLTAKDRQRLTAVQSRVQLAFNRQPLRPLDIVTPAELIARIYKRDHIFGPELFFGISVAEAFPDEKFLIIKFAAGATSLHGCWNPDWQLDSATLLGEQNEPHLYDEFDRYIKDVLSDLTVNEYQVCGMLWVQGETDAQNETAALAYGQNLQNLIQRVRQDVDDAALPFLLFEVGKGHVVSGMQRTAQKLPGVGLIPQSPDSESPDFYQKMRNGHYNYQGMKKLGERFAAKFLQESEIRNE